MKQYIVILLILISLIFPASIQAQEVSEAKIKDNRVTVINDYLERKNSPMKANASDFIEAADKYDLDWKLVVSIAGLESGFGKATPGVEPNDSYNAWGWGVYGTQAIYFKDFKEGIYTVSEGLKKNYIDRGYKNPMEMNSKYAESKTWGSRVTYIIGDIEDFSKSYEPLFVNQMSKSQISTQTAVSSAKLN